MYFVFSNLEEIGGIPGDSYQDAEMGHECAKIRREVRGTYADFTLRYRKLARRFRGFLGIL